MSKNLYCSQCHLELKMTRKALPKYATIVELVEPHTCLEIPVEFNFNPAEVPIWKLGIDADRPIIPKGFGSVSTADLRDRRFEPKSDVKSTAPESIRSMIDHMVNTNPSKPLTDLPSED